MTTKANTKMSQDTVEAPLMYYIDDGTPAENLTGDETDSTRIYQGNYEHRKVKIENARPMQGTFTLDIHGFEFLSHKTKVKDFYSLEQMQQIYYDETAKLIQLVSGATRVHVFDHTLRSGNRDAREGQPVREPVRRVHNDYTEWSGPQRVYDLLPNEANNLLKNRFAIIQVWRAINRPIKSDPLCICDARNIAKEDLFPSRRVYPDRVGETYVITHSARHKWLYFPEMMRDEVLIFKVYDSAIDGKARWTAHSSFPLPNQDSDKYPRESCEMRALVFFSK
tara:strand:- start:3798 stop:4637 length:840 start_codon:yes stop_codon:yes gene_type:complete